VVSQVTHEGGRNVGACCDPVVSSDLQSTSFLYWILYRDQQVLANLLSKYAVGCDTGKEDARYDTNCPRLQDS